MIEIITDPQGFLVGIPGVNNTGASDHLPELDFKARRMKKLIRYVVASLL